MLQASHSHRKLKCNVKDWYQQAWEGIVSMCPANAAYTSQAWPPKGSLKGSLTVVPCCRGEGVLQQYM